jgi:hypothetical protein
MEKELARISNLEQVRTSLLIMIAAYEAKGFTKCANLVKAKAELAALNFDRYREKYPQYLFFTDENFDEIVKRNKLTVTDVSEYTGSIPDHCFEAITAENIDAEDLRKPTYEFRISHGKNSLVFSGTAATKANYEYLESKKAEQVTEWISKQQSSEGKIPHQRKMLDFLYDGTYKGYTETRPIDIELIEKQKNDGLYIAAPGHMTTGNTVKALPRVLGAFQAKPLDPIVFRKVTDGVLVISFWK